jgi:hypothetical protein
MIEEVRTAGTTRASESQMIGLREIREPLAGKNRRTRQCRAASSKCRHACALVKKNQKGLGDPIRLEQPAALRAQSGSFS